MDVRDSLAKIIPHNNKRCTVPPGRISQVEGKPIIVSSMMRSGTHVLIDLILNNFPNYRHNPLYIDLDHYLGKRLSEVELLSCGAYVIKTHYPQARHDKDSIRSINQLANNAYIIQPIRDIESVFQSLQNFSYQGGIARLKEENERFNRFWGKHNILQLNFKDLIDISKTTSCIQKIGDFINQESQRKAVLPPAKNATKKVLLLKIVTRLLGCRAPVINTTIRFARTVEPIVEQGGAVSPLPAKMPEGE